MGSVTLQHMKSFCTRDQTCVPCIGSWVLNHWTTLCGGGGGVVKFFLKIRLFLAVLSLHYCIWTFSSCSKQVNLVPWPGIEPGSLQWKHWVLTIRSLGNSPSFVFLRFFVYFIIILWLLAKFCGFIYKLSDFLFYFCEKCPWDFDWDCIQSVDCFR